MVLSGKEIRDISEQLRYQQLHIVDQQRRLALFLEEAGKRLPEPFSRPQVELMAREEERLMDAFYLSFEDAFRGSRGA